MMVSTPIINVSYSITFLNYEGYFPYTCQVHETFLHHAPVDRGVQRISHRPSVKQKSCYSITVQNPCSNTNCLQYDFVFRHPSTFVVHVHHK